jgi:signal peptidase I
MMKSKRQAQKPLNAIAEWTIVIIQLLFLWTTLAQGFVIPTGSMEDSLLIGDHLIVDKLAYSPEGSISKYLLPYQSVKRGDIIVFRHPMDLSLNLVKRVVGVPGDRIRIENKQLFRNGMKIHEPYVVHKTEYVDSYRDNFPGEPNTRVSDAALEMLEKCVVNGELLVPPGQYFAMGDNRDNSSDSRYWGFVPRENIIGKPVIVYWSYDAPTEHLISTSISLEHALDLAQHFFTKTRWRRTFMLIRGYSFAG